MTIALHGSSPAAATGGFGSPITTVPFSPPANSLLVVCSALFNAPAVANSGTARSWALARAHASTPGVAIYTAQNPTALSNITISVTPDGEDAGGFKAYVFTGAKSSGVVGATGSGTATTNPANPVGYASTDSDSLGVAVAVDWNSLGNPSSTDNETLIVNAGAGVYGMAVLKAATTPTPSTNVVFNLDAAGTGTPNLAWVAIELLKSSLDASAGLSVIEIPIATPAPSVSAGTNIHPATVAPATSVPAPVVSYGAGATPNTVTAAAAVPSPSVTTDNAELVTLATVAAATVVPAPAVAAGTGVTLATVPAVAAVAAPSVVSDAMIVLPAVAVAVAVPPIGVTVPILPGDQLDGGAGQAEWNGFVLGRGTPYRLTGIKGWRGKEPPDSGNAPHANRHGSAPGRPLAREKVILWTGFIRASRAEVEAAVLNLENATPFLRDATQWPLVVNDLGSPYLQYGRIDRVDIPVEKNARLGHIPIAIQWIMADARRYNINATGVTCPEGVLTEVSNAGNTETNPLIVIPGPAVTPRMTNHTLGRVLEFGITLAEGEELVIDTDLGRARVNDVTDVMGNRSFSSVSVWDWVLDRGPQVVEYTTASGGTQAEVLYRDAWI